MSALKTCKITGVAPGMPCSWELQLSQSVLRICAVTEPQHVFLHLQLIVLEGAAVQCEELPTLTKQVPPLLSSPLGSGRIKAPFPTTLRRITEVNGGF